MVKIYKKCGIIISEF